MAQVPGPIGWWLGPGRRRRWRRRVLRRVLAGGCAVVAAVAVAAASRSADSAPLVRVVVAARPLAVGQLATPGSIREAWWPAHLVPADSATSLGQVLGRPLTAPMGVGELVTRRRVTASSMLSGQPADAVAVHVTVPDPGALAMVSAGDRVDLWSPAGPVARAVVVLKVDRFVTTDFGAVLQGQGSSGGYATGDSGLVVSAGQETARTILAVPQDALGRPQLTVVLRHPWPETG